MTASYIQEQGDLISADIEGYLLQQENKQLLRLLTCGNVDDGKSTLIGRLLHDSKMIYEDQLEAIQKDSKNQGASFSNEEGGDTLDLALLVDGLQAEREQGITIDVAYRYFSTAKRKFIIADTPGHEQYTRNMVTGASNSDVALVLIDARKGMQVQTFRHSYLVSLLGLKHLVVVVNKMDLVDYNQEVFNKIREDYLAFAQSLTSSTQLKLPELHFVPLSALKGDNVVNASPSLAWYQGLPLMALLENLDMQPATVEQPLRFPVQYVNRPNRDFRGYCGTLAAGKLSVGDPVKVLPSDVTSRVKSLLTANKKLTSEDELQTAYPQMAITVTLEDEIDISRGDILVAADDASVATDRITAEMVWMAETPSLQGKTYLLKTASRLVNARILAIHYTTQVNTLERQPAAELKLNTIARVELQLEEPILADDYLSNPTTGSFILIDRHEQGTLAAGMIQASNPQLTSSKIELTPVTAKERTARLGQKAAKITLQGGSKTQRQQLAVQLERLVFNAGRFALVIDEEELACGLAAEQSQLEDWLLSKGLLVISTQTASHPKQTTSETIYAVIKSPELSKQAQYQEIALLENAKTTLAEQLLAKLRELMLI
ncbi:sulfate adenylyltransferase subunit CysN [Marinospirillum insulare]|uniref:Sulfate adenylyltransferase subunit 1 n=1 Tax=Marinospirillum insulare TaxID=217169 RepID=A0ABQ5ZSG1_9GAMM|nr:sulfate adenylyltransferase subunit CysN [Marinospirillum insulare]GLR63066.1 bifunctional enzyme CysN/CysC [Marinospirillum insulare]